MATLTGCESSSQKSWELLFAAIIFIHSFIIHLFVCPSILHPSIRLYIPHSKSYIRPRAEYTCSLYAGAPKQLLAQLKKIHKRTNKTDGTSTHDSFQPLTDSFDVTSMAVFYKYMNSHPLGELSHTAPPFFPLSRKTRRHTPWSNYLKEDTPKKELGEQLHPELHFYLEPYSRWYYYLQMPLLTPSKKF